MNDNIKITAEISKSDVLAVFYLAGEELTDEEWKRLSESPITLDWSLLSKSDRRDLKMALAVLATLAVLKRKAE